MAHRQQETDGERLNSLTMVSPNSEDVANGKVSAESVEDTVPHETHEAEEVEAEIDAEHDVDEAEMEAETAAAESDGEKMEIDVEKQSDEDAASVEKGLEADVDDVQAEDDEDAAERPAGDAKDSTENPDRGTDVDSIFDQTLLHPLFEQRDKSLKELLEAMDEFSPIIPDAVTDYFLARSGFKTSDQRIKRLLALATQKFVGDIASDAYQFSRIRAQTATTAGGAGRGRAGPGSTSGRVVLTMESLMGVLGDYGINAERPDYYR